MCNCFDRIPACDKRTNRQTDGQTDRHLATIVRAMYMARYKITSFDGLSSDCSHAGIHGRWSVAASSLLQTQLTSCKLAHGGRKRKQVALLSQRSRAMRRVCQ